MVITDNLKQKDILSLEEKIKKVGTVQKVVSIADITGTGIPVEMLPDDIKDKIYKDNDTIIMVTFSGKTSEDSTMNAVDEIRKICDGQAKVSGMTSTLLDTKTLSDSEVAIYVCIAVLLCLIVLQIALDSYFAPILLLTNIGFAVLYNMGTNIFLGEISYITKAISAVLQLGVTMDFAIFLYHSYIEQKEIVGKDKKVKKNEINDKAMSIAITKTMTSVLGSAITTMAGFIALCSMNLTLGKDIGIVMAKGVLIGLLCAITVLPSLILVCDKLIEKTKHKPLLPKFNHIKEFNIKHNKAIIVISLLILPFAYYGYKNTGVYYKLDSSLPDSLTSIQANKQLKDDFGMVSTELLLVDKNISTANKNEMVKKLDEIEGIDRVVAYSKISNVMPEEMLPDSIKEMLQTDKYELMIISSKYEIATDELNKQQEVNSIIKEYDQNAILAGEGPLMNDLVEVSNHDFKAVNYVSLGVIFIIMIIVLKSGSLPVILLTTIDYAILITTKYIDNRKNGRDKIKAIDESLSTSINSVVVSALCFFGATFGVGVYSKIELIGSLCNLMARGAIVSMVVVITLLPALLVMFDKLICKTTKGLTKVKC